MGSREGGWGRGRDGGAGGRGGRSREACLAKWYCYDVVGRFFSIVFVGVSTPLSPRLEACQEEEAAFICLFLAVPRRIAVTVVFVLLSFSPSSLRRDPRLAYRAGLYLPTLRNLSFISSFFPPPTDPLTISPSLPLHPPSPPPQPPHRRFVAHLTSAPLPSLPIP